jgi:transposase-like protein
MARGRDPEVRRRWTQLIRSFQPGRESVAEFCRRHDVSTASFYKWRRELDGGGRHQPAFVPVRVSGEWSGETVRFHFASQARVDVPVSQPQLIFDAIVALAAHPCEEDGA